MNERQQQTINKAIYLWELGTLRFLRDKGIITEEEYNGISQIIEKEMFRKIYSK